MTSDRLGKYLAPLTSSNVKHVFDTLVDIRTRLIKLPNGVTKLVIGDVCPKLLQLINPERDTDDKTRDLVLSILGNMCMEEVARVEVQKSGGIPIIAEVLCTSEQESVQNRCGRTLANLALHRSNLDPLHKTEAPAKIVELLHSTKTSDYQQTYCRAIRLLGQTKPCLQQLVTHNAIFALAKLLITTETPEVQNAALRALAELASVGCTPLFAAQVVSSGATSWLLEMVKDVESPYFQQSFTLVFHLAEHSNFRPPFGAAGGIQSFIELLDSEHYALYRTKMLNCLCLCCKDAVNRVRLREAGALQLFLRVAQDETFSSLYDRMISSWLCFLYDDQSFQVLLSNGLVPCLLSQLQRCVGFVSTVHKHDHDIFGQTVSQSDDIQTERNKEDISLDEKKNADIKEKDGFIFEETFPVPLTGLSFIESNSNLGQKAKYDGENEEISVKGGMQQRTELVVGYPEPTEEMEDYEEVLRKRDEDSLKLNDRSLKPKTDIVEQNVEEDITNKDNNNTLYESSSCQVFSIDSPTYQPDTEWDPAEYSSGIKCKQSFSPPDLYGRSPASASPPQAMSPSFGPYSPLSNNSYYSPTQSSPDNSQSDNEEPGPSTDHHQAVLPNYFELLPDNPDSRSTHCPAKSYLSSQVSSIELKFQYSSEKDKDESCFVEQINRQDDTITENYKISAAESEKKYRNKSEKQGRDICINEQNLSTLHHINKDGEMSTDRVSGFSEYEKMYSERKNTGMDPQDIDLIASNTDSKEGACKDELSLLTGSFLNMSGLSDLSRVDGESSTQFSRIKRTAMELSPVLSPVLSSPPHKKRRTVDRAKSDRTTENNILMLMSRISQALGMTKYLVTEKSISCIVDYLKFTIYPLPRMERLFVRVLQNPHMLQKILKLQVPILIHEQLLIDEHENDIFSSHDICSINAMVKSRFKEISFSRSSSMSSLSSDFEDMPTLGEKTSHGHQKEAPGTSRGSCVRLGKNSAWVEDSGVIRRESSATVEESGAWVGLRLIQELSYVVGSHYSRGEVANLFHRGTSQEKRLVELSMPFIIRTSGSVQFYMSGLGILNQLLSVLEDRASMSPKLITLVIDGLCFLAKTLCLRKIIEARYSKSVVSAKTTEDSPGYKEDHSKVAVSSCCDDGINLANDACQLSLHRNQDVKFSVNGQAVSAVRSVLIKKSDIFAAMLTGKYSESGQSEIHIRETSHCAFQYLIHYLHDCDINSCAIRRDIEVCEISETSIRHVLDMLSLADRYLLSDLHKYLLDILIGRFLVPKHCHAVFRHAVVHDIEFLREAAIVSLMVDSTSRSDRLQLFSKFLSDSFSPVFLQTIETLLLPK